MKTDSAWEGRNGIDLLLSGSRGLLGIAWHSVRLPVFALLVVFEPIFRVVLSTLAILSAFFAFFFEYLTALPRFPFWGMLAFSAGCALSLLFYYFLIRLFSR